MLYRFLRLFPVAVCASVALAACGGGHGAVAPVPSAAAQSPISHDRHVQSTCTPDSYGYCLAETGHTRPILIRCDDGTRVITQTYVYNLLYNGSFVGQYSHYYDCGGDYWDPGDPSANTGDPNLP